MNHEMEVQIAYRMRQDFLILYTSCVASICVVSYLSDSVPLTSVCEIEFQNEFHIPIFSLNVEKNYLKYKFSLFQIMIIPCLHPFHAQYMTIAFTESTQ